MYTLCGFGKDIIYIVDACESENIDFLLDLMEPRLKYWTICPY